MFYIFLPSLGECGRLDTDNVSPEIANLIILSTSLHSTLVGALIRFIINKIPSLLSTTPGSAHLRQGWREITLVGNCQVRTELAGELWVPVWNLEKYWQELQYSEQGLTCHYGLISSGNFSPLPCLPPTPHRNRNNLKLPCSVFESQNQNIICFRY